MKDIRVIVGGKIVTGFSPKIEVKVERIKLPWWRIIEFPKGHPDYKKDATTLAMIDKCGVEITLSLKNGSDSLKEIFSCDPYGENKFEVKAVQELRGKKP